MDSQSAIELEARLSVSAGGTHPRRRWPEWIVEVVSSIPIAVFYAALIPSTTDIRVRAWPPRFTWEFQNYWGIIEGDLFNKAVFALYCLSSAFTALVVVYHVTHRYSPKRYINKMDVCMLLTHIFSGTVVKVGLFVGLLTGSKLSIATSCVAGIFLFTPSVFYQQQTVYGHRELTMPVYSLMGNVVPWTLVNVIWDDASYPTLVAAGMALHVFAWVRAFGHLFDRIGMQERHVYDRSVLCAGMSFAPFILSPAGCVLPVLYVVWWNFVFNMFKPFPRVMLQHNFRYSLITVIQRADGKDFLQLMEDLAPEVPDWRLRVPAAVYQLVKKHEEFTQDDLVHLFKLWGLPNCRDEAHFLWGLADTNGKGFVTLTEFKQHFAFIYNHILDKGV